ncbi:MAG: hypothetical protein ACYTEV_01060 [Planctomycetota bacterium]
MSEPPAATAEPAAAADGGRPRPRPGRRAATILGLVMLAGAVAFVVAAGDRLAGARAALASPDPGAIAAILAAVAINLLLTGAFFRLLYARHARIGMLEMQAVMAAASLLNYLPLRPGLAGRVAYHRAVHGVPVRSSVLVMVQALGLSGLIAAAVAMAAWASSAGHLPLEAGLGGLAALAGLAVIIRRLAIAARPGLAEAIGPWPAAALLRLAEVGCVALRTWAAFALVGQPITAAAVTALAATAVIVGPAGVGHRPARPGPRRRADGDGHRRGPAGPGGGTARGRGGRRRVAGLARPPRHRTGGGRQSSGVMPRSAAVNRASKA